MVNDLQNMVYGGLRAIIHLEDDNCGALINHFSDYYGNSKCDLGQKMWWVI